MLSEDRRGRGDSDTWDKVWRADQEGTAFTLGKPRSVRQLWQRCYFEDLKREFPRMAGLDAIELGSGRATTSLYMASAGANVTLVDLAPTALSEAKRFFASNRLSEPTTVLADACSTGLPAASYDVAYNIGVLEHFLDPSPLLRESARLLRPGGLLWMVVVPDIPTSRSLPARLLFRPIPTIALGAIRAITKRPVATQGDMTRTSFGASEYREMARSAGFKSVECIPYNAYHDVYRSKLLQRLILVPSYRMHYRLRASQRSRDVLETASSLALCLLLKAHR